MSIDGLGQRQEKNDGQPVFVEYRLGVRERAGVGELDAGLDVHEVAIVPEVLGIGVRQILKLVRVEDLVIVFTDPVCRELAVEFIEGSRHADCVDRALVVEVHRRAHVDPGMRGRICLRPLETSLRQGRRSRRNDASRENIGKRSAHKCHVFESG